MSLLAAVLAFTREPATKEAYDAYDYTKAYEAVEEAAEATEKRQSECEHIPASANFDTSAQAYVTIKHIYCPKCGKELTP